MRDRMVDARTECPRVEIVSTESFLKQRPGLRVP